MDGDELPDGVGSLLAIDVLDGEGVDVVFNDGEGEDAGFEGGTDGGEVTAVFEQHLWVIMIGTNYKLSFYHEGEQ